MKNIQVGNIITTTTDGEQLLVKKVFKRAILGESKRRKGSKPHLCKNQFIQEVQVLHGDRFSYELRQDWL